MAKERNCDVCFYLDDRYRTATGIHQNMDGTRYLCDPHLAHLSNLGYKARSHVVKAWDEYILKASNEIAYMMSAWGDDTRSMDHA